MHPGGLMLSVRDVSHACRSPRMGQCIITHLYGDAAHGSRASYSLAPDKKATRSPENGGPNYRVGLRHTPSALTYNFRRGHREA
jgi:hypothetical protein